MFGCGLGAGSWRRLFGGWPWQALAGGWRLAFKADGWRLDGGRLVAGGGWRSRRAFKVAGGGWRSWATTRGQFCGGTIHETSKTVPNTQNSRSSSTKTPILCLKRPKIGVPKGKSAQKPQFCAQNARKWGFRKPKKHKNPDFVLGKKGIGSGKR